MEEVEQLESDIVELRKLLQCKEGELYDMKQKLLSGPKNHGENGYNTQISLTNYTPRTQMSNVPKWAIERYSRQILLPDIGVCGQEKLMASKVLVVGAGGLGCPAAVYLAGAGVGEIGIVDYDCVDITNIHRQILHEEKDENTCKADSAAESLRRLNTKIKVTPYNLQLDSKNALQIISHYDLVMDCTDNVPTRFLLNDACVMTKKPLISGSALKMEGQLTLYGYRSENNFNEKDTTYVGPCYRCVFPAPPPPEAVGSCSANGVAGPVPGIIGAMQALEAIKLIVGQTHDALLVGRMLLFDGEDMTFRNVKLRPRNPDCAVCSPTPTVTALIDYEVFCKAQAKEKRKLEASQNSRRRQEGKLKRMSGQSYIGYRTKVLEDKKKQIQDVPKSERKMGTRCNSEFCERVRDCKLFSEKERHDIFKEFWNNIDWKGKKMFVRSLVDTVPAKRRRIQFKEKASRKGPSKHYHLLKNGERKQVCRTIFLNTLGIKEATVRCWLMSDKPKSSKKPLKALNVDTYIDKLPQITPKCQLCIDKVTYVNIDNIKNVSQLYNMYAKDMKSKGVEPASRKTFSKVISIKNIRIFKPKNASDVCDLYSEHNIHTTEYSYGQNKSLPDVVDVEYYYNQWQSL